MNVATKKMSDLPLEIVLNILWWSSQLSSTEHARNVCSVSRAVYDHCWPSLWRIICLRNAAQLRGFSEEIYAPSQLSSSEWPDGTLLRRHKRKQDAVQAVYLNNNKDVHGLRALSTREKPEMWMISIMLSARNLRIFHAEEYWSMSYPWEAQEEKPLIAYPLILLSRFATAIEAVLLAAPDTEWARRLLGRSGEEATKSFDPNDIYAAIVELQRTESLRRAPRGLIAQPSEVTLSALAMSPTHLQRPIDAGTSGDAFDRLTHLHLYFAKMDKRLLEALGQLPILSHLRLTRPFSEMLLTGVETLLNLEVKELGSDRQRPTFTSLVIEGGLYMDKRTADELHKLAQKPEYRGRLIFMTSNLNQAPYMIQDRSQSHNTHSATGSNERSSTGQVIDYVTNSEERGFRDFVARAQGLPGVWQIA